MLLKSIPMNPSLEWGSPISDPAGGASGTPRASDSSFIVRLQWLTSQIPRGDTPKSLGVA